MTALQPLLAIVTLLLCFCGTLADQGESQNPVVPKGMMQTQLPSATAEDLLMEVDRSSAEHSQPLVEGESQNLGVPKGMMQTQLPSATAVDLLMEVDWSSAEHSQPLVEGESQNPGVPKGMMQTQLPSATAEDLLKEVDRRQVGKVALKGKDRRIDSYKKKITKEELEIELKTLIPILEWTILNAKTVLDNTPNLSVEKIANNITYIKDTLRSAGGCDNQPVAGEKNAKDKLQGIVKVPSSIKVVQAVTSHPITDKRKPGFPKGKKQTQLPSATAEDLSKEVDGRQVGNVALKGKDQLIDALNKKKTKEELEIELKTLIPNLESSILNAKNLLANTHSMSAEELATNLKPIKDTLRPVVGGDNQIVAGLKQAKDNLQGIVNYPSSNKDYKVVQAVTSQPITDEVINLLVNTPSMSVEEIAKHLKTIKDTLRPAVGGDNQIVAGVKQAKDNLQCPSSSMTTPSYQQLPAIQSQTRSLTTLSPKRSQKRRSLGWRGYSGGPDKVVM